MSKTYLVTGANRGLGLEFARQLSARGDRVLATARDPDSATELKPYAERIDALDVTDATSVEALGEALASETIDVLINNGGVFPGQHKVEEMDFDALADAFAVNSIGPMRVVKALLGSVRRSGPGAIPGVGRIVNISTQMGSIARADGGAYAYRSSKAALNMLTKLLGQELRDEGIICVALHPGWVKTRMGGEKAPLTPEESIAGMLRVIDGLRPEQTGAFLDYKGETLPW
ncbi:MAG: SDR family oxidoreductase [Phycisphaeraceae bacterium]|nr:MAG: SDR family oxidoreductase [Phycisphaeraceae bacterium]